MNLCAVCWIIFWIGSIITIPQSYVEARTPWRVNTPTAEIKKQWEQIENSLDQANPKVVETIDQLLTDLVKQENETTLLLEQKAATQMGSISIVVAILLAVFSFFIQESRTVLSLKLRNIFLILNTLIVGIFIMSMYWSYQGFAVRDSFATYNVDDLFKNFNEEKFGLKDVMISSVLENYQVLEINSQVNEVKAAAIALAARFFIIGLIGFTVVSLVVLFMINRRIPQGR